MVGFPISVISGLLSAASWGTGDFMGGLLSKRTSAVSVTIVMEAMGAALLATIAVILRETLPSGGSALWSVAAGLAGAVGLQLLYTGLASGTMGIVAPLTAVVGATVPIVVAAITHGMPSPVQSGGFLLALAAVWLMAGGSRGSIGARILVIALTSGIGFGLFYVLMARVEEGGLFWPLAIARTTATLALIPFALLTGSRLSPPRALLPATALVAVFDTGGNFFYLLAAQTGRLDTAAVLSSLYPAMTVLLAWIVLKERLSPPQWAGVAAALLAIPLIVA